MSLVAKIQYGTELPYSIEIDKLHGVGYCPASAVMAALSVGKKIPSGMRDKEKSVSHILKTYPIDKDWSTLINIIKENKFDIEDKCEKCVFGKIKSNKPFLSVGAAQCLRCSENYDSLFILRKGGK